MAIRMEAISRSQWGSQEQTPYMFPNMIIWPGERYSVSEG